MESNHREITCSHCNSAAKLLYTSVNDRIFWNDGEWNIYKCEHCRTLVLNPPPAAGELGKYYQTYYTHVVEKSFLRTKVDSFSDYIVKLTYFPKGKIYQKIATLIIPKFVKNLFTYEVFNLSQKDGTNIFDVGFGNGNFISKMVRLGVYPSGCDFDKRCVELVKDNYNLEVYLGSLSDVNNSKKYEVITYGHVVEHLYSLREELVAAKQMLAENGRIVGLTPNIESLGHLMFKKNWRGLEPPRHLNIYSMNSIKKIAEECGYRVVKIKTTARYARHILAASLMIKLNRKASVSGGGRGIWIAASGYILQLVEWSLNLIKGSLGEEIFFVLEPEKHEYRNISNSGNL